MRSPAQTKILTVEDDEFVREIIVAFLEDSGYVVLQAENGRKGLELFRSEHPDLLLLDLRMPEIDGLEVLSVVTKEAPDTPAIVVSGMGTIGDAIKALKLGAWDYIAKPIHDMAVLEHSVSRALERSDLLRENRLYREHLEDEVKKRTSELEQAYAILQQEVETRKQAEATVSKVNLELTMLSECIHAVVRATDETELVRQICRTIVEVGGYRMAWVGFVEHDEARSVRPIAKAGRDDGYLEQISISWADTGAGQEPTGRAIRNGQPVVEINRRKNAESAPWREEALKRGFGSSIALPLRGDGKVFGSLSIHARDPDAFDLTETQRLHEVSADLAYGIIALRIREERNRAAGELQANLEKLEVALEGTVKVVASTVEVRDPYTAGHQRRVATLAQKIATRMALPESEIEGIYMAGLVHDLGKIYVPAEILSKPSRLSGIEFNLIRTHPQVGYDLLKTIEFPWPIAEIVYQHHEKINGSGYPRGLSGADILLEAKILTVADVVEAMASHRPYRPSLGIERALEQITRNRGTLYDPEVVDTCLGLFAQGEFAFD
ncbi:MAG: response regulator [Desulfobacterales bacterium]|nr:response regulator [Desulfobacterales bacterium]